MKWKTTLQSTHTIQHTNNQTNHTTFIIISITVVLHLLPLILEYYHKSGVEMTGVGETVSPELFREHMRTE